MSWFGDLFDNAVGAFSGYMNNQQQRIVDSANQDREYNALREDTQYQRLVNDLDSAGLNKWLAVNGSANPSAQMLSQTTEANSRARELGQKYMDLFEKVLDDSLSQANKGWSNANDSFRNILKYGMSIASFM